MLIDVNCELSSEIKSRYIVYTHIISFCLFLSIQSEQLTHSHFCPKLVNYDAALYSCKRPNPRKLRNVHTAGKIFGGNQTNFFGYGIVTIEMFEKKMFQIMCHMMGCNDSSG